MAHRAMSAEIIHLEDNFPRHSIKADQTQELDQGTELLAALLDLRERYLSWQDHHLFIIENTNCQDKNYRAFLTRDCCDAHKSISKEGHELVDEAQYLTGDTHPHPMSRCDITAENPIILSNEWWDLQLKRRKQTN